MMKRIRTICAILLCGILLLGCGDDAEALVKPEQEATALPAETPEATAEAEAETPSPEPTEAPAEISLTWAKAFRISTLPDGTIMPDEIAFLSFDENGTEQIVNVPKEEVFAYRPERLPRSRTLEQYIPEKLDTLLVTLDYALAHGYCRFSIPTTAFTFGDILGVHQMLNRIFYIDGRGINSLDVQSFETADGETLTYVLVTISGIPDYRTAKCYLEGVAEAEKIVASVPEGSTEFETALYLYHYLTENVVYDSNSYYEKGKVILLYDALVKKKTVCAGYTEALYYLYNLAGIDCMVIEGYITDPAPLGDHAWNIARIDGTYYQFDSTWDAELLPSYYSYFAVSDEYMMANHTQYVEAFSAEFAPACPQSMFPEMHVDEFNVEQYPIYYYYQFLEARESDPMSLLSAFGMDIKPQTETEDGWVVTNMQYELFRTVLTVFMETDAADRFCEGYYADRDGMLAFRKPTSHPVGWRVCGVTKQADGSYLTEAYLIDETGALHPAAHVFRLNGDKVKSVTEQ